jgi:hypothetical protein
VIKFFLLGLLVIVSVCSSFGQATKTLTLPKPTPVPPPGNIQLLPNYSHIRREAIHTSVGDFTKPNGMTIRYLIGFNAESGFDRICYPQSNCLWSKKQIVNGRKVWIGLSKKGEIVATFTEKFYPANFYAEIKSSEDIADFLIMVLTYKAQEPPSQKKPKLKN